MNQRYEKLSVQSDAKDISVLHEAFDKNHAEWMSCHNVRQWVKRRQAEGKSIHACSDFGYGYVSVRDYDQYDNYKD